MSKLARVMWLFVVLTNWAEAAVPPQAVHVQVDVRTCVVGYPVAVTFQLLGPARQLTRWDLTDATFTKDQTVTVLAAETRTTAAGFQHRVVITATRGGRLQLGPFPVVARLAGAPDTLYAPAITVHFKPERLGTALHPLRAIRPAWEGISYPWQWGARGWLLLGAGATCWLAWRKWRRSALEKALTAARARQMALAEVAALERKFLTDAPPPAHLADQLFGILNDYFQRFPAPTGGVDFAAGNAANYSADKAIEAARAAILAELTRSRFAPSEASASGTTQLLNKAKWLLAASDDKVNTAGQ